MGWNFLMEWATGVLLGREEAIRPVGATRQCAGVLRLARVLSVPLGNGQVLFSGVATGLIATDHRTSNHAATHQPPRQRAELLSGDRVSGADESIESGRKGVRLATGALVPAGTLPERFVTGQLPGMRPPSVVPATGVVVPTAIKGVSAVDRERAPVSNSTPFASIGR